MGAKLLNFRGAGREERHKGIQARAIKAPSLLVFRGRFASTISSVTQRCNVGTMLQPFETVATLCSAENCPQSSCVTNIALLGMMRTLLALSC